MRRVNGGLGDPLVSVLTPSLPERDKFLQECCASVRSQTTAAWEHLVAVDEAREGFSTVANRLADAAAAPWVFPLGDDDLLLPGGLAALLERADDGDVIYSPPLVTGNEDRWWFFQAPPVLPATALIRADLWEDLGGYDETVYREEDRGLWIAALEAGARFVRVDAPTWVYRMHDSNKSFQRQAAA